MQGDLRQCAECTGTTVCCPPPLVLTDFQVPGTGMTQLSSSCIPDNTQDNTLPGTNFRDAFLPNYGGTHNQSGGVGKTSSRWLHRYTARRLHRARCRESQCGSESEELCYLACYMVVRGTCTRKLGHTKGRCSVSYEQEPQRN